MIVYMNSHELSISVSEIAHSNSNLRSPEYEFVSFGTFLGAFATLLKVAVSYVMSACTSVHTEQLGPIRRIFMKFCR
jgi:hypothetical protein